MKSIGKISATSEMKALVFVVLEHQAFVDGKRSECVPSAKLYAWRERSAPFADGRVHAKVAVADDDLCFITSASLTGHAMEQNMVAGVLLSGGQIPRLLHDHLQALVDTNTVSPV